MNVTVLPRPVPRTVHRPYLALAGLQVMDVLTTGLLLNWWSHTAEGNPVARLLTDHGAQGLVLLLAFKLLTVALLWCTQSGVRFASALYVAVLTNNVLGLALLTFG